MPTRHPTLGSVLLAGLLCAALGGCASPHPQAKPSVPPSVTAPDPKPANGAQAASDAAAQERLSKLSANVNAAATAPNIEASPVAVNELTVAQGRLSDVKPDPVEVAAAAERQALQEAGRAAEARENAKAAAGQGRSDAIRIAELQATATTERVRADAAVAAYAAQAELNRIENQKAIDAAIDDAKKAQDRQRNSMLHEQAAKLTWIGIGCISAAISIAVLVGFFGSILMIRKLGAYLLALAVVGFLFLGAAQIITQWWFMWACAGVILIGCIWFGVWAWRHQKRGDLAEELASRTAKVAAVAKTAVPVWDAAYESATAETKAWLDANVFDRLSSTMNRDEKATVHEVRAEAAQEKTTA
ncbi:MAG: hypothetical protein ABFD89_07150 [Bryobacteraceae bacterium]